MASMIKELKQLEEGPMIGKKVVTAINPETLSAKDKAKSLNAVNIIKQNEMEKVRVERVLMGASQKDT